MGDPSNNKAVTDSGDCSLIQINEEEVELKFNYDYKVHSSVDLSKAPSVFDDAHTCFMLLLK